MKNKWKNQIHILSHSTYDTTHNHDENGITDVISSVVLQSNEMTIATYQRFLEVVFLLGFITHVKSFAALSKLGKASPMAVRVQHHAFKFSSSFEADAMSQQEKVIDILQECAIDRSAEALDVISTLENLEKTLPNDALRDIDLASAVDGKFELIFSSAVANIPLIGNILGGYMPNREIITFDLKNKEMSLVVELLPFLPSIDVYGDSLVLNDENATLEYTVRGKEGKPPSQWKILFADDNIVAARSSVTGLNVIRRIS